MSIIESVKEELLSKEIVNEVGVLISRRRDFSIHVNPDSNKNLSGTNGAYFKFIHGTSFSNSKDIARISFYAPEYIIHKRNRFGQKNITLEPKEKTELMDLLRSKVNFKPKDMDEIDPRIIPMITTNWQMLIYKFNKHANFTDNEILAVIENNYKNKPDNMIRLDLPMPDYSQL